MSKKKDTRQLLIESSEFTTKISIPQTLKESLEMSKGKAGTLIVKNIPATLLNRPNQNNRIYSTQVIQEAIDEAKRNHAFELKSLLGKPNEHPEGSFIAPSEASHVVINAYIKPNVNIMVDGKEETNDVLFMDWEVLNTRNGQDLRALLEAECSIGTSIRGLGDLNGQNVQNYQLLGIDCVGNPSSSTYTRMIMSESVEVELKDPRDLKETFTVTTSSTNVVKDLDTASALQADLDHIGYGTVVKTSTKLDSETDPKTGAQTTITTLEAETEDDVSDLDQALMMAKNAMLNGKVSIDSVTIENIKEEEPKESAENKENEKALNEEDELPLSFDPAANPLCGFCHERHPKEEMKKEKALGYVCPKCAKEHKDIFKFEDDEAEYIPESEMLENNTMTEAGRSYLKTGVEVNDFKSKNRDMHYYVNYVKDMLRALLNSKSLDSKAHNDAAFMSQRFEQAIRNRDLAEIENLGHQIRWYYKKYENKNLIDNEFKLHEATEEKKDPKEGKKFVLKTPSGFVAMDGNALVFKDDPKQALQFIYGKEESGLVHLSGVEKILDAMGVYDVEKYFHKDTTDISAPDEIANNEDAVDISSSDTTEENKEPQQECNLHEEDNTGGKFTAIVVVDEMNGSTTQEEIPVASTELSSMQNEIGNLFKQKSQNGQVRIQIRDNDNGAMYIFNPQTGNFDALQESNDGEIEQDDNKLSIKVDDDHTVEKEFDTKAQASVAKAGVEQGKLSGDVLLNEEDKGNFRYEDIEPGWYVSCPKAEELGLNIGVTGPYKSREEALAGMEEFEPYLNVEEITEDDLNQVALAAESSEMNEVLFKNKGEPSDPYINEPLKEEEDDKDDENIPEEPDEEDVNSDPNEDVVITLGNIDWDIESISTDNQDIEQMIMNLPETLQLTVKAGELDTDEPEKVRETLMDLANKSSVMKINNATILDIK